MSEPLHALYRLNSIHRFLREVGKRSSECQTRTDLFETVCRAAVEIGGFRMAWIGINHGNQIVPVSMFGDGADRVRHSKITLEDSEDGDFLRAAMQENRFCMFNDPTQSGVPPWFVQLHASGVVAAAVLPLRFLQKMIGILVLGTVHSNDFSGLAVRELQELGSDINDALKKLDDYSRRIDLELQLRQLHQAVESSATAVVIADTEGYIQYVNPHFTELTGFQKEDVLGTNSYLLRDKTVKIPRSADIMAALRTTQQWRGEVLVRTQGETPIWTYQHIAPVKDFNGNITHVVSTFIDHTELHFAQQTIEKLAYYDELTKLPNRRLFYDRIQHSIEIAQRDDSRFCVFYLDLDGFKHINDSLGHAAGDELLQTVAQRLRQQVRAKDTVARLGGDEFTVIVTDIAKQRDITVVAESIIQALAQPVEIADTRVVVTTSIGIALYPEDGSSMDLLTRHADLAMYDAKARGKNNFQFFTKALNQRAQERMATEHRLREAFLQQQFCLSYLPQMDAAEQSLLALEVVASWPKDEAESISQPGLASMLAEYGLADDIFEWQIQHAGLQCAAWLKVQAPSLRLAFSIPATLFANPDKFMQRLQSGLTKGGLGWDQLQLEIPETAISQNIEGSLKLLDILRNKGARLVIDNFASGLSSLRHLRRFDIDLIKLDISVSSHGQIDDAAVTAAIISLAHQLGLRVLAKGVENSGQARFLNHCHCDYLQGNYIAMPLGAYELARFLAGFHALSER